MFSSDDHRSLHIIVCFYQKGWNRCWAIWPQFGGKGWQMDICICHASMWCVIKVKVEIYILSLFLQDMADAWQDQWVPGYSQSSTDIYKSHPPQIPSTPQTLTSDRASMGNLHAQTAPFFDTPADSRSTQYVTYQLHFHSTPSMQGQLGMTSMISPLPESCAPQQVCSH